MAQVWRLMMLAAGLLCVGIKQVAANAEVLEMKDRLSSIEASQQKARDSLLQLGQTHAQDIDDKIQYCQDLKSTVAEQGQLLLDIKQHLQDELCKNESHPVVDNSGPCHPDNYTVIDDERRAINGEYHGYEDLCDKSIQPGWYRFLLHHRNAVVPTACVPKNNCQTDAPTWVDLQDQSPPGVGQQVEARACSHWYDNCCHWEAPITVRNCGDYFVYKIQPLVTCDLSFCVESAN